MGLQKFVAGGLQAIFEGAILMASLSMKNPIKRIGKVGGMAPVGTGATEGIDFASKTKGAALALSFLILWQGTAQAEGLVRSRFSLQRKAPKVEKKVEEKKAPPVETPPPDTVVIERDPAQPVETVKPVPEKKATATAPAPAPKKRVARPLPKKEKPRPTVARRPTPPIMEWKMDEEDLPRMALGVNYTGGQIGIRSGRGMWEARYQTGQNSTEDGPVRADVVGLRYYRHAGKTQWGVRPYMGFEGDWIRATDHAGLQEGSGYAAGGFFGVEWWLGRRLSIGTDVGAYMVNVGERETKATDGGLDFIINSFVRFHLF